MFLAIAVLVLVAGAAAALYVNKQTYAREEGAAQDEVNFAAHKAATQLDFGIAYWVDALYPIASDPKVAAQLFADPSTCTVGYGPIGTFDSGHIDIVRSDGSIVCSSRPGSKGAMYSGERWLQTQRSSVIGPIVDSATGHQVAVIVDRVADLGFIAVFEDLKPLGAKLASEFGSGAYRLEFMVTTKDGKSMIARSIDPERWTGASLDRASVLATSASERRDVDGTPRIYGEAAVPSAGWTVYVGADKQAALLAGNALLNESLWILVAGMVTVFLAMLVVYLGVARPIATLSEAVRKSGSMASLTFVAVSGPTQVRTLGRAINGLITAVTHELTERHTAEAQLRDSLAKIRTGDEQRRRLLASLVTAQEEERQRIAADIHDDSIQAMTAIGLRFQQLRKRLTTPSELEAIKKLEDAIQHSINRLRRLMFDLRPPALDRAGLVAALSNRLEQMQADAGVAFEVDGSLEIEPPSDLGIMLYRIAMEALTNVSKHANATRIQVRIASKDRGCLIAIHDDGVGFQLLENGSIPGHLGLTAMQERAEIAGGWCKVTSRLGAGTTVEFWAPITEEARDLARSA
jgi:signal transduction histidine kinase